MPDKDKNISVNEIKFFNGRSARVAHVEEESTAEDIIHSLELEIPQSVIFIAGGAENLDEENQPRLIQFFSRGIAQLAIESKSLIIDGGTDAGVMSLAGMAIADRDWKTNLLGIAPENMVLYPGKPENDNATRRYPLEPNHSHFILVKAENFGGEKDTLFKILQHFSVNTPIVMILVNGGTLSKFEVLNSVRMGISIIVVEGSGRLADNIAELKKKKPRLIEDPIMAEIIDDGNLHFLKIDEEISRFKRLLQRLLSGNSMLREAWEQWATFDFNAKRQKDLFHRIQFWILVLAVLATTLAVIQEKIPILADIQEEISVLGLIQVKTPGWLFDLGQFITKKDHENGIDKILKFLIILIPITISVFIAASNRFQYGKKWIFLRSAAEEIKQEIYKYRTRAGIYSDKRTKKVWRDIKLANKLSLIRRKVMNTEVNSSGIKTVKEEVQPKLLSPSSEDDGISFINPDQYIKFRLDDQLAYYKKKTVGLANELKICQWAIYIAGGLGTLLAAAGGEIWVAVTIAAAGSITTYMQYKQIEKTLMEYNQSAGDLSNIKDWWIALTPLEQSDSNMIDKLVGMTENIFRSENVGWVQQMQDMIEELQEKQSKKSATESEQTT